MSNNDMSRAADDMNLPMNSRPFSGSVQKIKKKKQQKILRPDQQ